MSKLLFIIYRAFEKLTKVRLESIIGWMLFSFLGVIFKVRRYPHKTNKVDKRLFWDSLRNDGPRTNLASNLSLCLSGGLMAFENSMETSLRAINLIACLVENKIVRDQLSKFEIGYIWATMMHTIICPDLYLKRKFLKFYDESNNHRFYNLLFFQYFHIIFEKRVTGLHLESFVKMRLVDGIFYDEGSSFYHVGIVDSLLKLKYHAILAGRPIYFSSDFENWLCEAGKSNALLETINFGDRDGTKIYKSSKFVHEHSLNSSLVLNTTKFFLKSENGNAHFIRKENWCLFGTNGHAHDDFGHVSIFNQQNAMLDVGIHLYKDEPKLATKQYHNFPNLLDGHEMVYHQKFEREPYRNVEIIDSDENIELVEKSSTIFITRNFNKLSGAFSDFVHSKSPIKKSLTWMFYFKYLDELRTVQINEKHKSITVTAIGQIIVPEDATVVMANGMFSPEYAHEQECVNLKIILNIELGANSSFKILEFNPA